MNRWKNTIHRGDCLEVMQHIPTGSIDSIICDLPYGTTACKWDTVIPFEPLWKQYNRIIKSNGAIVLFGSEPFSSYLRMSNIKNYKYDIIWQKDRPSNFMMSKKQILKMHENISIFYKKQPYFNPQKTIRVQKRKLSGNEHKTTSKIESYNNARRIIVDTSSGFKLEGSIVKINSGRKKSLHPTQKPVALLEYLIRTYTNENETVLDNTAGSFTTAIACIKQKRNYIMIEKDKHYFEIGKKRIAEQMYLENQRIF